LTSDVPAPELRVTLAIPAGHYVYGESWAVLLDDQPLQPLEPPPLKRIFDPLIDGERDVLDRTVTVRYRAPDQEGGVVVIGFQGCSDTICFNPETHRYRLVNGGIAAAPPEAEPEALPDDASWLAGMRIAASAAGYLKAEPFLAFLKAQDGAADEGNRAGGGFTSFARDPSRFLSERGWWLTVLLILAGGLLLNLTPCVLPMIPINLAIIGAGARQGSRRRGFLLGGIYGAGMALAYGVLGLTVVVTGGFFGALQSHPVFNLAIALVFVALGLSLFDLFPIDFTRFQRAGGPAGAGLGMVLSLGAMSALLAGACVAPVVIAVLLLAGRLFAEGVHGALALPFLLGVGMALPWPFAGAGLSVLPRPGGWMKGIKVAFGIGVLLMALYYGRLAGQGFRPAPAPHGSIAAGDREAWQARLAEARAQGKPVVVDFWATWCKNCHAMSRTTLRDPAVIEALKSVVFIPVQAERPDEDPARGHLRALGVAGLPTYLMLVPVTNP
jgi:thiol:disulfide interchange protein